MDDRSFDRLARLLGEASNRRTGLKALVAGLIGVGGLAALDADAKRKHGADAEKRKHRKKRRKCNPACDAGFTCVKGRCTCASGVTCAGACCAAGQTCRDGGCAEPLGACLAFGDDCKGVGKRCCDGLTCASGQDGSYPVACYRSKGAACAGTVECPFGMTCTGGVCLGAVSGIPTGQPCASGATCDQPGATCTAYTGAGAPAGDFCTLPLRTVCTGDPDCTCYHCWYVNGGAQAGSRAGRASTNVKACCHPAGQACAIEDDCCSGLTCDGGICGGSVCVPEGGACADGPCCGGASCQGGVCAGGGGCAFPGSNLAFGASCCEDSQCTTGLCWYPQDSSGYPVAGPVGLQKVCRVAVGATCSYATYGYYYQCGLGTYCDYGPTPNVCYDSESYPLTVPTGGTGCDANHPCAEEDLAYCSAGTCVARTPRTITQPCNPDTDVCVDGSGDPESYVECQTYSDGAGSGATDTTTTYCLGNVYYPTTDAGKCAGLRVYNPGGGSICSNKCKVYLDAGQDDAARGAALKQRLEAFAMPNGFDWFYIEPDMNTASPKTYATTEITINLDSAVAYSYPSGAAPLVVANCYVPYSGDPPRPIVSGGSANRILNVSGTATNKGFTARGMAFENGNATGDGGAIRISTPNADNGDGGPDFNVFDNVTINGSTASGDGGGVWVDGPIKLVATEVKTCTAGGLGGGVYAKTKVNQYCKSSMGTTITQNTSSSAASNPGAGLYWDGTAAEQMSCSQGGTSTSITGNTDAITKMDCAYGATAPQYNWLFCGCGYAES